jgi:hypothetical protein
MLERYNVVQFLTHGPVEQEYVRRMVPAEEAAKAFKHYTTSVAAQMGVTTRVIITDGDDCISAEWTYEHGITFPPEWVEAALATGIKATRGQGDSNA